MGKISDDAIFSREYLASYDSVDALRFDTVRASTPGPLAFTTSPMGGPESKPAQTLEDQTRQRTYELFGGEPPVEPPAEVPLVEAHTVVKNTPPLVGAAADLLTGVHVELVFTSRGDLVVELRCYLAGRPLHDSHVLSLEALRNRDEAALLRTLNGVVTGMLKQHIADAVQRATIDALGRTPPWYS